MRFLVLGSGLQGRTCAYDLLRSDAAHRVMLADRDAEALASARDLLARLLPEAVAGGRLELAVADAADPAAIGALARGAQVVASCVPYFLNLPLAQAALAAGAHFLDLGGSTPIVLRELELDAAARARGVAIVPDCGLGPGMISTVAVHAMAGYDRVDEVRIYDGGLPQRRDLPPLGYRLVFSVEGLINEYVEQATALVGGRRVQVPGLSEVEELELPEPLGRCEAAHAAGGLSTMAWTYEGRVGTMFNKLIRYPGHIAVMRALGELGFFAREPLVLREGTVPPRAVAARLLARAFEHPGEPDLVYLRVVVRGERGGRRSETVGEMLDREDPATGLTAMMRTTGFPAAIVAGMLARGEIPAGAHPVERGVPAAPFLAAAEERGFRFSFRTTPIAGGDDAR